MITTLPVSTWRADHPLCSAISRHSAVGGAGDISDGPVYCHQSAPTVATGERFISDRASSPAAPPDEPCTPSPAAERSPNPSPRISYTSGRAPFYRRIKPTSGGLPPAGDGRARMNGEPTGRDAVRAGAPGGQIIRGIRLCAHDGR